mmetsp:Transcript_8308/g.34716  ORF Transcript_8308/g.34716 Transcript_8308/m.34716 type:complete len:759 (-) Transcript_8308:430-2706(-)
MRRVVAPKVARNHARVPPRLVVRRVVRTRRVRAGPARRGDLHHHLQVVEPPRGERVPRAGHGWQKTPVQMARSRDEVVGRARSPPARGLPHHRRASRGVFHEVLQLHHPPLGIASHQAGLRRAVARNLQLLRAHASLQRADQVHHLVRDARRAHRRDERSALRRVHARLLKQVREQRARRRRRGVARGPGVHRRRARRESHRGERARRLEVVRVALRGGAHGVDLAQRGPVEAAVGFQQRRVVREDVHDELLVHHERVVGDREPHQVEPALAAPVHRGVPLVRAAVHVPAQRRARDHLRRRVEAHEARQDVRGVEQLVAFVVVRGGSGVPVLAVLARLRDGHRDPVRRVQISEPSFRDAGFERRLAQPTRRERVLHALVAAVAGLVPPERPLLQRPVVVAHHHGNRHAVSLARRRDARQRAALRHAQRRALLLADKHHDPVRGVPEVLAHDLDERAAGAWAADRGHRFDLDPRRGNHEVVHRDPPPVAGAVVVHVERELLAAELLQLGAGPAERLPVPPRADGLDREPAPVGESRQRDPQHALAVAGQRERAPRHLGYRRVAAVRLKGQVSHAQHKRHRLDVQQPVRVLAPVPRVRRAQLVRPGEGVQEAVLLHREVGHARAHQLPVRVERSLLETPPQRRAVVPLLVVRLQAVAPLRGRQALAGDGEEQVIGFVRLVRGSNSAERRQVVALVPHGEIFVVAQLVVAPLVGDGLIRRAQRRAPVRPLLRPEARRALRAVRRPRGEVARAPELAELRAF